MKFVILNKAWSLELVYVNLEKIVSFEDNAGDSSLIKFDGDSSLYVSQSPSEILSLIVGRSKDG